MFHGLRNYDGHLLLTALSKCNLTQDISVVPHNMEQYVSFSLIKRFPKLPTDFLCDTDNEATMKLVFVDSYAFMNRSLSDLAGNLDRTEFKILKSEIYDNAGDESAWLPLLNRTTRSAESKAATLGALIRKGVYPYDHIESLAVFDETALPTRDQFFSKLSESSITESEYEHAEQIWKLFEIRSLGEYHDLYLATDVLLLADLFENFRSTCQDAYDLDPAHYLTTASLSWDACLKMTRIELDAISDPDLHLFFESGVRGGVSQISHRFAKANNEQAAYHPVTDVDDTLSRSFIIYLDMNNLYGTAMIKNLPDGNLEWIPRATTENEFRQMIDSYSDDDDTGFVFEVDLEYSEDLHDAHNDMPLAPENRVPPEVSPITEKLSRFANDGKLPAGTHSSKKLISHFLKRENYVVHVAALKFYLGMGMKVVKFHRAARFHQSAWIKPYIDLNTRLRQEATSAFRKDFFKLMNNRFDLAVIISSDVFFLSLWIRSSIMRADMVVTRSAFCLLSSLLNRHHPHVHTRITPNTVCMAKLSRTCANGPRSN